MSCFNSKASANDPGGDKLTAVTWSGGSKTFGYDAAGRTTSVVTSAGTTTLAYDFESRLVSMAGPGLTASYAYNGLDSRRSKTVNGVARSYLRDGAYVTDPLLHEFAPVDRLRLSMRAYQRIPLSPAPLPPGERGSRSWASVREHGVTKYLHSGLKNVDAQSSGSQSITATRVYDAFGNVESSSGSWTGAFGYGGPYGYQSAGEGGLMLLGHRYYDPSTGRFLTRDPAKYGASWYVYAENSPVRYSDPVGQWPINTVMDVIGIGMSLGDVIRNPHDPGAWGGLIIDVGAAFTPYVPGSWIKGVSPPRAVGKPIPPSKVRAAELLYPKKAGKFENHHVIPKYIGGDPKGPKVRIPAAYHQLITKEFRKQWPYAQGKPSPEKLSAILVAVYRKYPIPH